MILILIGIVLLGTFPSWHKDTGDDSSEYEVKPFPSRAISYAVLWLLGFSQAFGFMSALWLHVSAATAATTLEIMFGDLVSASVGTAVVTFAWIAFFLNSVAWLGVLIMILSIRILDRLTDED